MPSQQFSKYTQDVWSPAAGTGAVEMPIISQPGGAKPEFKPANPYAAMAAEMVGEMAYNAAAEAAAPKGEWNEALGKWVYTKQPGGSMFNYGDDLPEDSIWNWQVPALMKEIEIKELQEKEAEKNAFINKSARDNEFFMEREAYDGPRGSDWSFGSSIVDIPKEKAKATTTVATLPDGTVSANAPDNTIGGASYKETINGIVGTWTYSPELNVGGIKRFVPDPAKGNWGWKPDSLPSHYAAGSRITIPGGEVFDAL